MATMGFDLDFITKDNFIARAVDDVGSAVGDIGPLRDLMTGPVRDFANSTVGNVILTAVVSTMTQGLAQIVGPQLATAAFAAPGMLRGESFDEAWVKEFAQRVKDTANWIVGHQGGELVDWVAQIMGEVPGVAAALQAISDTDHGTIDQMAADLNASGLSPSVSDIANSMGVREDVVASVVAAFARDHGLIDQLAARIIPSDPLSGKLQGKAGAEPVGASLGKGADAGGAHVTDPCALVGSYMSQNPPGIPGSTYQPAIYAALAAKCDAYNAENGRRIAAQAIAMKDACGRLGIYIQQHPMLASSPGWNAQTFANLTAACDAQKHPPLRATVGAGAPKPQAPAAFPIMTVGALGLAALGVWFLVRR